MKQKLSDLAAIAEVVGAAAVVVSLLYVGASVNQNTRAIMVANHQALVAMDQDTNSWLRDLDFAATYTIALEGTDSLSPAQVTQVRTFLADKFNAWEFAFRTHSDGMMADNIWDGWDGYYRSLLEQHLVRSFWANAAGDFLLTLELT